MSQSKVSIRVTGEVLNAWIKGACENFGFECDESEVGEIGKLQDLVNLKDQLTSSTKAMKRRGEQIVGELLKVKATRNEFTKVRELLRQMEDDQAAHLKDLAFRIQTMEAIRGLATLVPVDDLIAKISDSQEKSIALLALFEGYLNDL